MIIVKELPVINEISINGVKAKNKELIRKSLSLKQRSFTTNFYYLRKLKILKYILKFGLLFFKC